MITFDLVLADVHVVDPHNHVDDVLDIGIRNGCIASLSRTSLSSSAAHVVDLHGYTALPGIIDIHTHLTSLFGAPHLGYAMLARAGVCTAMEVGGPLDETMQDFALSGCGLNLAALESLIPGRNLSSNDPSEEELERFIRTALAKGALGIKLLGGHFPLTPEASVRAVRKARELGAYVCWHSGHTEVTKPFPALLETCELIGKESVHVPHVNGHCRGLSHPILTEVQAAMDALESHPNIVSESYIAVLTAGRAVAGPDGRMESLAMREKLLYYGFEDSLEGVEAALRAGVFRLYVPWGDEIRAVTGEEGVRAWREGRSTSGGWPMNPWQAMLPVALARRKDGDFVVDAFATDGGSLPRNETVLRGLSLVELGALSLEEFIRKSSYVPSRILCLSNKGHLAEGADADITVVDLSRRQAIMTIVGGQICMIHGHVLGQGGCFIRSPHASQPLPSHLHSMTSDPANGPLPFRCSQRT